MRQTVSGHVGIAIKPLVQTMPLYDMPPYAFKFFIPDELFENVSKLTRFDKIDYRRPGSWEAEDLKELLARRMEYCFDGNETAAGEARSFTRLFSDAPPNLIDEMIEIANGSPRNLIRFAKMIFRVHTDAKAIPEKISMETYEKAKARFRQELKLNGDNIQQEKLYKVV